VKFNRSITEIIPQRYSCRIYNSKPVDAETRQKLQAILTMLDHGPLGTPTRFELVAATEQGRQSLRGLGTYGFIRGATGFVVGSVDGNEKSLEDFGYRMEQIILAATGLGLGTCWLGGSFTKSSFVRKIHSTDSETVPAVASIGYAAKGSRSEDWIRQRAKADNRLSWETIFFQGEFSRKLSPEAAGAYATPLEMLRLGPSASNKQPWRIVRDANLWHFYLQRTRRYGKGSAVFTLLKLADLQRVDMGIAMCHFELTANELGLLGQWVVTDPGLKMPDERTEYIVSWTS
jgi:nitroreductase